MSERKHSTPVKTHPPKSKRKHKPTFNEYIGNHFGVVAISVAVFLIIVFVVMWIVNKNQTAAAASPTGAPAATEASAPATQPAPAAAAATETAAPTDGVKKWDKAPAMTIDKTKKYTATVKMAKGGEFVIQLYPDKAPITVNSFVFLARQGYFDGTTFHRVLEGFMAQGGDPTGSGMGGPGYEFVNENSDLTFDKAGVVAMANAGPDTNGSQFFITFGPTPQLNGGYTIFGQVISGMDVVNGITRRDPDQNPSFTGDAIATVTITEQ